MGDTLQKLFYLPKILVLLFETNPSCSYPYVRFWNGDEKFRQWSEGPAWAWACFFIMPRSQLAIVLNEQFKYIMIIHFWFRIERPYIREYTVHTIQMSRSTVLHLLKGSLLGRRYRRPGCQTSDFCKLCLHLCASSWHQLVSILWQQMLGQLVSWKYSCIAGWDDCWLLIQPITIRFAEPNHVPVRRVMYTG